MEISKEQAIALFGSQAKLAEALDIFPAAVSQWKAGQPIPEKQALRIRYVLKPESFSDDKEAVA
jgi:DNA-binding transcriptional regulator YdaS (Cro superfamily)